MIAVGELLLAAFGIEDLASGSVAAKDFQIGRSQTLAAASLTGTPCPAAASSAISRRRRGPEGTVCALGVCCC
jgi:hypothetical protein